MFCVVFLGLFVCACTHVLRSIGYAFAVVRCKVASHVTRV